MYQPTKETLMSKLLSTLIVAAFALTGISAQAASHAGAAPMKASAPEAAASGAKKAKEEKKAAKAEKKEAEKK
jgi:ribosomal protein L12E/L44/L45/RPP1/RPP2